MPEPARRGNNGRQGHYTGLKKELGRCRKCGLFHRGPGRYSRITSCTATQTVSNIFSKPIISDTSQDICFSGGDEENANTGSIPESDSLVCECLRCSGIRDSGL